MSILNRPSDGLLSVLLALRRALVAYGPQSESRLVELCAPTSVVPDGKPDMARKTLTRWKQLGFFHEADGELLLHPTVAAIEVEDIDALRSAVLRLVLAPENNPALSGESGDDNEKSKASDYTFAAAWALTQDPYSFPAKYKGGVESLQAAQVVEPRPFANDTRWAGFAEWASFLGIAWSAKVGLVLDSAFAVRFAIQDVFVGTVELPQDEFLTRLSDVLPVLDGGRYQLAVQSQIGRPWRTQRTNQISPCLSAAMLTLEARGDLRLEARSDAPQRILLGREGRELRPVSHVVRLGVS
ncbi:MAG TPA: protein DpdG [Polyangiaceae bacterium]|nr:protein DpdG [Polyangiaceae bacterium]